MDLTGSIADAIAPLSSALSGSAEPVGSSLVDITLSVVLGGPGFLLDLIGEFGKDLGSSGFISPV